MASENDDEVPTRSNATPTHPNTSSSPPDRDVSRGKSTPSDDVTAVAKDEAHHREILDKLTREQEELEAHCVEVDSCDLAPEDGDDDVTRGDAERDDVSSAKMESSCDGKRSPAQTEIKTQRPPGLLAQHGLVTQRTHLSTSAHDAQKDSSNSVLTSHLRDVIKTERNLLPPPINALDFTHPAFLERQFSRPPSTPGSPSNLGGNGDAMGTHSGGHHWTFEEQFKQVSTFSSFGRQNSWPTCAVNTLVHYRMQVMHTMRAALLN